MPGLMHFRLALDMSSMKELMMKNTRFIPTFGRKLFLLTTVLLFLISLAACGGGGGGGTSLTVSPATANVVTGLSLQLTASVGGVSWSVNGITGGNATIGTVNASGVYTAPTAVPTPAVVTVTATIPGTAQSASASITIIAAAAPAGTFSAVGNLVTARSNHTATLLATGDVLVAGGIGTAGAAIANAELFRSATNDFAAIAPMGITRAYHRATMLQNGKVLITGGFDKDNNVLAQAELYDPATKTFSATGSMSIGRVYHTATLLYNGKVLIAGGSTVADLTTGVPLDSIEIYDPATGKFTVSTDSVMADHRFSHSSILLNNGKVLLVGGIGLAGQKLATAELYDPASAAINKISATGSMATPRWLNTITSMADGTILVVGGSSGTISGDVPSATYLATAETYDPGTGLFTDLSPVQMSDTRGFHTTTLLADSSLLIAGGYGLMSGSPLTGSSLATAELFTPGVGGAFAYTTGNMPLERANHTATILPSSGRVLLIGGSGYNGVGGSYEVTNSAIVYQ
jgi:Galactose oxidase, central domain/Kelch motif